jgi:hypothetical protein
VYIAGLYLRQILTVGDASARIATILHNPANYGQYFDGGLTFSMELVLKEDEIILVEW